MNIKIEGNPRAGILTISEENFHSVDYSDYQPRKDGGAIDFIISAIEEYLEDYFRKNT